MATNQKQTNKDTVTISLPRAERGQENFITASVNGKVWKLQRGVEIEVPRSLAEVLKNSRDAAIQADDFVESKM